MSNDAEFGFALIELGFLAKHTGSHGQWTGGNPLLGRELSWRVLEIIRENLAIKAEGWMGSPRERKTRQTVLKTTLSVPSTQQKLRKC